jgi:hypothetical protein
VIFGTATDETMRTPQITNRAANLKPECIKAVQWHKWRTNIGTSDLKQSHRLSLLPAQSFLMKNRLDMHVCACEADLKKENPHAGGFIPLVGIVLLGPA